MKGFVKSVCRLSDAGEAMVLATVVESNGSTPRSSGAKMIVRRDGSIIGTVGGGLAEAMTCREGCAMLDEGDGTSRLLYVDMTQELAADSDMICGGGLSILLETVEPEGGCAGAYRELDAVLRKGGYAVLHSRFDGTDSLRAVTHRVVPEFAEKATVFQKAADACVLMEAFTPPPALFIFGAGHVSQFTARIGSMVGFRTVVLDDRSEYANAERFPEADEIVVLPSYEGCCDVLGVNDQSYIVIVTRGHLHDRNVLAEALRTEARYVGMIGSTKKRDKIYQSLIADGLTMDDIKRCHCPIGLSIGGQTPEEIAVSIGAELIQVRSGGEP